MLLEVIRYTVFGVFAAASFLAAAGWAVRTRRVSPFSALGRGLRRVSDPVLEPIERRLVKSGGNPQSAGWWLVGIALIGGILVVSLSQWVLQQVALVSYSASSPRGVIRLVVYYAGQILSLAIIARVIGSWVGAGRYNRWMRPAYLLTDWIIEPLRKIIPPLGMFDITPIVAWFLLKLLFGALLGII